MSLPLIFLSQPKSAPSTSSDFNHFSKHTEEYSAELKSLHVNLLFSNILTSPFSFLISLITLCLFFSLSLSRSLTLILSERQNIENYYLITFPFMRYITFLEWKYTKKIKLRNKHPIAIFFLFRFLGIFIKFLSW